MACFSMSFAAQTAPDLVKCSGVLSKLENAAAKINAQFAKSTRGLDCPALAKLDNSQFNQFPGYSKLKCKTGNY